MRPKYSIEFIDTLKESVQRPKPVLNQKKMARDADPLLRQFREVNKALRFTRQLLTMHEMGVYAEQIQSLHSHLNLDLPKPPQDIVQESYLNDSRMSSESKRGIIVANVTYNTAKKVQKKNHQFYKYFDFEEFTNDKSISVKRPPEKVISDKAKPSKSLMYHKLLTKRASPRDQLDTIDEAIQQEKENMDSVAGGTQQNQSQTTLTQQQSNQSTGGGNRVMFSSTSPTYRDPMMSSSQGIEYSLKAKHVSPRRWMEKFEPPQKIPIKEANFIKQRSRSPPEVRSSQSPRENEMRQNDENHINDNTLPLNTDPGIPYAYSQVIKNPGFDKNVDMYELLKSEGDLDQEREKASKLEMTTKQQKLEQQTQMGQSIYQKPLSYFQYSVNRYKKNAEQIHEVQNKNLQVSQIKNNFSLTLVKNNVNPKKVESQYSNNNLKAFLTGTPDVWQEYDKSLNRKAEHLKFDHTNRRFLQQKPSNKYVEDASKRNSMKICQPEWFNSVKPMAETYNHNKSLKTLSNMMED